jgi:hypothetical protein
MHVILFALILQGASHPPQKTPQIVGTTPITVTPQAVENYNVQVPEIVTPRTRTTPSLTEEFLHAQMIRDISGQGAEITNLQAQVQTLQSLRTDPDRKDIDSLKDARTRIVIFLWVLGILGAICGGAIRAFGRVFWRDTIVPFLRRSLQASQGSGPFE